jgi:hypothetical protein
LKIQRNDHVSKENFVYRYRLRKEHLADLSVASDDYFAAVEADIVQIEATLALVAGRPELARIASPNVAKSRIVIHDRETISYEVMDYDYSGGIEAGKAYQAMDKNIFWAGRIAAVAQRTPAWIDLFAPLAKQCRDAITANPRLGRP